MNYLFKKYTAACVMSLVFLFSFSSTLNAQSAQYLEEINDIAGKESIKNAFNYIEKIDPKTTEDLIMLTEIPAPPFKEERRAQKYKEMLEEAGLDSVWIDEVGN